jgi:hypothetical protein
MPLVSVTAKLDGDKELIARLNTPLDQIMAVRDVVKRFSRIAQTEATQNVSNRQVSFEGNTFVIKRQTGNLARSIQVVEVTPLSATIIATGGGERGEDYAAAVEEGHREFDLKPYLVGKTIPLVVKAGTPGAVMTSRTATTGRSMGGQFVIFRRVSANSNAYFQATDRSWIIPAAKPRPFMGAAGAAVAGPFADAIAEAIKQQVERGP